MMKHTTSEGFTLVELLITMVISALVMTAVVNIYLSQQKAQTAQEAVSQMQQNIRSAMLVLTKDIREAGCDPTGEAGARILQATKGKLQFSRDIAGNPVNANQADGDVNDANENVTFGFPKDVDNDGNGVIDNAATTGNLGRDTGAGLQPIAQDMAALEFNYIIDDGSATTSPSNSQLNHITGVQISLLARSERSDQNFSGNQTYTTASGAKWGPFADNYRRRLEIVTVHLRN